MTQEAWKPALCAVCNNKPRMESSYDVNKDQKVFCVYCHGHYAVVQQQGDFPSNAEIAEALSMLEQEALK